MQQTNIGNDQTSITPPNAKDTLIVFSDKHSQLTDHHYQDAFKIYYFNSFEEWGSQPITPSAFVIESHNAPFIQLTLSKIRRHHAAFAALCFVLGETDSTTECLSDGNLPQVAPLQKKIQRTLDLEQSFKKSDVGMTHLARLIKYLWMRPDYILRPFHDWQHPRFYRYPLLEALCDNQLDSFEWLQTLISSKILQPVALIDRQRECIFCRSSHLSFIDICPNCRAIDIGEQISLHCFTCGCIDIQERFIQNGTLVCPKCTTQLRHIGSDYDRPIENHNCQQCHQTFSESDVLVRCAMCEKKMQPSDLVSNKIYSWQLSDRGRILAIRGDFFDISSSFDQLNFISRELFIHDLNWALKSSQRYPDIQFSLFGIYFANLTELAESIGYTQLLQMLEVFSQRLRSILRTPDLSTRTNESMLWFLLPHTSEKGLNGLKARVSENLKSIQQTNDQALDYRLIGTTLSQLKNTKEDAELLIARLSSELM